jgi:hypothetical protein
LGAPQPKAWNGHGYCQSVVAYNLAKGTINGVDVSGLTLIGVVHIPGNILEGNWKQAVLVDDRASDEQMDAMLQCFSGALGGPLADLTSLVGERVSIERAKIEHSIVDGGGTLKVEGKIDCAMQPYRGPDGSKAVPVTGVALLGAASIVLMYSAYAAGAA